MRGRRAPSAVGFSIKRRYDVMRDRNGCRWAKGLREGDWVRITLIIRAARHATSSPSPTTCPAACAPPTWRWPASPALAERSPTKAASLRTRKLDPRKSTFYAQHLPAGPPELHYFARVGNSGDYLAAPAMVELMYGNATNARTAADRLQIADKASGE